jgi:ribonuclease BN (tRNA processing enzyme)
MRLTVLGKSPSYTDAGGACSGYLIEDEGTTLLLDCGNGVFAKLRQFVDYTQVDAVVISHLHADHILDLVPYSYALRYAPRQQPVPVDRWPGTESPARPALHAPEGATACFRRVVGAWGNEELIEDAFALREYGTDAVLEIGPLRVRFHDVPHFVKTNAVEITSVNGGRITYGADHRPSDELVDFAQGTDLLLIEATLPRPERDGDRGHLTPEEAGEHGRRAGAKQVVLTHISDELDGIWATRTASQAFGGPVALAAEGQVFELSPNGRGTG